MPFAREGTVRTGRERPLDRQDGPRSYKPSLSTREPMSLYLRKERVDQKRGKCMYIGSSGVHQVVMFSALHVAQCPCLLLVLQHVPQAPRSRCARPPTFHDAQKKQSEQRGFARLLHHRMMFTARTWVFMAFALLVCLGFAAAAKEGSHHCGKGERRSKRQAKSQVKADLRNPALIHELSQVMGPKSSRYLRV